MKRNEMIEEERKGKKEDNMGRSKEESGKEELKD
jgi:hypothetical protein